MLGCILILSLFAASIAFNIDTLSPIVYKGEPDSYFGYSVALYPGNTYYAPGILIGAPRGKTGNSSSGSLYKYGIKRELDKEFKFFDRINIENDLYINNSLIGASLDINQKNGRVVTCAPKLLWQSTAYNSKQNDYEQYGVVGGCFFFKINDTNGIISSTPLKDTIRYKRNNHEFDYGCGQAGFSAHITETDTVVLGSPGMFNWEGSAVLCKTQTDDFSRSRRSVDDDVKCGQIASGSKTFTALHPNNKEIKMNALLGYSSTSGYFQKNNLSYVAGAPRFQEHVGNVFIYTFTDEIDDKLNIVQNYSGVQNGEYFGATVTAGDVDNDGLDDLIVGSPFYSTNEYNEGRIYYFPSSNKSTNITINGTSTGGQFGACVQYLGHLDNDMFGDIAVAAPYEEGSGVVYIFRGSENGLISTYSQRIVGKSIYPNIKGFGISISKTADIDSNDCLDVAIGSYKSGHAVVLRTRPAIAIKNSIKSTTSLLEISQSSFEIDVCVWIDSGRITEANISRTIILDSDQRATLGNKTATETITISKEHNCQKVTVYLTSDETNKVNPIKIGLAHKLIETTEKGLVLISKSGIEGEDHFCRYCPVYDQYHSTTETSAEFYFNLGCGDDEKCTPNLRIDLELKNIKTDTFIVDSMSAVDLIVTITNTGEKAYNTKLLVILPEIVGFRSTPGNCLQKSKTVILCDVANVVQEKSNNSLRLDLDLTRINNGKIENSIEISAIVSVNKSNETSATISKSLKRDASVELKATDYDIVYYDVFSHGSPNFTHQYKLEKQGSSIHRVDLDIYVPTHFLAKSGKTIEFATKVSIENSEGPHYQCGQLQRVKSPVFPHVATDTRPPFATNTTVQLNCSSLGVVCSKMTCSVGWFPAKFVRTLLTLSMRFDANFMKTAMKPKDEFVLTTMAIARISNSGDLVQKAKASYMVVDTVFRTYPTGKSISWWIIILAIILGLLLLAAVIAGLKYAGFFERKIKDKTMQVRQEEALRNDGIETRIDRLHYS